MRNDFRLGPSEKVTGKPFTDLHHSVKDLARLIRMTQQLVDTYESPEISDFSNRKSAVQNSDSQGNEFKIYYIQSKKLFSDKNLSVVGFFGYRRPDADVKPLVQADKKFEQIFNDFEGLLSLSTARLPNGNFANLVLFTDDDTKDRWNFNPTHYDIVTKISPPYYTSVRLNNGILPDGVNAPELMKLTRVRYIDYTITPHWRAVRKIETLPG